MLSPEFREKLVSVLKKNKGRIPLTMFLTDPDTKYRIEFLSNKFQVAVSSEMIDELKRLGIVCQAIRK